MFDYSNVWEAFQPQEATGEPKHDKNCITFICFPLVKAVVCNASSQNSVLQTFQLTVCGWSEVFGRVYSFEALQYCGVAPCAEHPSV